MMLNYFLIIILTIILGGCTSFPGRSRPMDTSQAAVVNMQLGLAYLQQGDVQRAHQRLLLAEQQAPDSIEAKGAMGYFLESTGSFGSAEAYFRRAVELNPNSGMAQNNYATFLCRRGHYLEADQHFLLALRDASYLNTALVYENAGLCAMQIPDEKKSTLYFKQAVMKDPTRSMSWLELGRINYRKKNYLESQRYLDRYMELTQEPTAEALLLGYALEKILGNPEKAGKYALMLQTRFRNSEAYKTLVQSNRIKNKQKNQRLYY